MVGADPSVATHGRTRMMGVRTWLGAGALALGFGAALAGAAGVAQADTGRHQPSSAASNSTPDGGPTRTSSVSSAKHSTPAVKVRATAASARVAKVNSSPLTASTTVPKPSAAVKARPAAALSSNAVASQQQTQIIDTPFGPISLSVDVTTPDLGQSGPVSVNVTATTPIGGATFALAGNTTFTNPPPKITNTVTSGTVAVPSPVAFVASVAGAVVNAGLTAADSLQTFLSAASSGDIPGAFLAWAEAAPKFAGAVLFGAQTLDLPLQSGGTGPVVVAHIPVGGLFSPLRPLSVSWDDYSFVDGSTGATIALVGGSINFAGSQFGGAVPAFFRIFGI